MPDSYLLNRDGDESQRLERQHGVWSKNLGYLVHPKIAGSLPVDARVADLGTGTAIWAIELARQNPRWHLTGLDISDAQFPAPNAKPDNVTLQIADLKEPFPPTLLGKFDLVHLRLLVLALDRDEWPSALANIKTLLKPGGWVQWEEIQIDGFTVGLRGGSASEAADGVPYHMNRAIEYGREIGAHRAAGASNYLSDAFKSVNFKDVIRDMVAADRVPELRAEATRAQMRVVAGMAKQRLATGGQGAWSLEELKQNMAGIDEEINQGAYCMFYIQAMIGRI